MNTLDNGRVRLLLAGQPQQVASWAGWFALQEHIETLTAIQANSVLTQLHHAQVAILDASLFTPPKLLELLGINGQSPVYVQLPNLQPAQAQKIETALRQYPTVRGVFTGETPLDVITPQITALRSNTLPVGTPRTPATVLPPAEIPPVVVAVWNGEGGVGKTTVSTNLSYAIAQTSKKTLYINLDAPDDGSFMLGLKAQPNIEHWRANPKAENLFSLIQQSGPLHVLSGFRDVFSQEEAINTPAEQSGSIRQLVKQAKEHYQVIVLDTPQSPIAAHVLAVSDHLILVARPGVADAHRSAVAYRTVVDQMTGNVPAEAVYVVLNRIQSGHRLDAAEWSSAASTTLGRTFPKVVAQIQDDVAIGDLQDARKIPVAELGRFRDSLAPAIQAVLPAAWHSQTQGRVRRYGPFVVRI
jgi:cellulose biosynthesis protein BcsQ